MDNCFQTKAMVCPNDYAYVVWSNPLAIFHAFRIFLMTIEECNSKLCYVFGHQF